MLKTTEDMLSWILNNSRVCGDPKVLACQFIDYQLAEAMQEMKTKELAQFIRDGINAADLADVQSWIDNYDGDIVKALEAYFL